MFLIGYPRLNLVTVVKSTNTQHSDPGKYMKDIARLFSCTRCHGQVFICSKCDHGNVYCLDCAPKARLNARRRASARYQASHRGRLNHAARQQRYREKLRKKVTHKGSTKAGNSDLLNHTYRKHKNLPNECFQSEYGAIQCHTCRALCSPFLRNNHLRSSA